MTNDELAALDRAARQELLPCPFCGGAAEMRGHKAPEFWVGCPATGCKATTEGFGSQERAARAWNTRANQLVLIGPDAVEVVARAREAWRRVHEGMERFGMESSWIDTVDEFFERTAALAALGVK